MPSGVKGSYRTFTCIECNSVDRWAHSAPNKFCNILCQQLYKWKNETIPRIEQGECSGTESLKKFLIEQDGNFCAICNHPPVWNDTALVLQLDHIDGDSDNNFPVNIRLLCPNCHSQTPTFGSKGKGNRYKKTSKRNTYLQKYKSPESAAGEAILLTSGKM